LFVTGALFLVSPLLGSSPAAPECRMPQLGVSVWRYISEATEQHTLALRLVNRGKQVCTLYGYPRVTLYDARGVLPLRIRHGGDQMISARAPGSVRLEPGKGAFLVLNKNACVNGSARVATRLVIARGTEPASLRFPRTMPFPSRIPDSCVDASDAGSVVTVSAFVPTLRAALHG
jgi:hypothetical protein